MLMEKVRSALRRISEIWTINSKLNYFFIKLMVDGKIKFVPVDLFRRLSKSEYRYRSVNVNAIWLLLG
jgi:hypothetical protein